MDQIINKPDYTALPSQREQRRRHDEWKMGSNPMCKLSKQQKTKGNKYLGGFLPFLF